MPGACVFRPSESARRRAARASLLALIGFVGLAALVPLSRAGFARSGEHAMLAAETVVSPMAGVAAWLVWRRIDVGLDRKRAALRWWGWLLMLAALWPALLAGTGQPAAALPALLACPVAAGFTTLAFGRLQPLAALLLLPFIAWLLGDAVLLITHFWNGAV